MFTGTADGRVVKLENGEIETIARFGSGPCSKLVTHHSESYPFPLDISFTVGELLIIWQMDTLWCHLHFLLPGGPLALECPVELAVVTLRS